MSSKRYYYNKTTGEIDVLAPDLKESDVTVSYSGISNRLTVNLKGGKYSERFTKVFPYRVKDGNELDFTLSKGVLNITQIKAE